uniref:Putative palmitoyltransferase zdhhc6 n=1 Tax=Ixodes ricinus TaxID=34613 RepID=A0A0K8R460_IXORI
MVHLHHTPVALPAVMGPRCLVRLADLTILEVHAILRIFRFPSQGDKARTNKHSIEVIIKNHDSPVYQHDEIHTSSSCIVKAKYHKHRVNHGHHRTYCYNTKGYNKDPSDTVSLITW